MKIEWKSIAIKIVVSLCFLGEAVYIKQLHKILFNYTTVNYSYEALKQMQYDLFVVQDGLEVAYRGLFVFSLLWLLLALMPFLQLMIRKSKEKETGHPSAL